MKFGEIGEILQYCYFLAGQNFISSSFSDRDEEHCVSWKAVCAGSGLASVARELAGQECVFQVLSALPEASLSDFSDPANKWHDSEGWVRWGRDLDIPRGLAHALDVNADIESSRVDLKIVAWILGLSLHPLQSSKGFFFRFRHAPNIKFTRAVWIRNEERYPGKPERN